MPNILDLIQRIAIEGDAAIATKLKALGDAGASAFSTISDAAGKIAQPFGKFQADLGDVEKKATAFGSAIGSTASQIGSFVGRSLLAVGGLAAIGSKIISSTLGISTALRTIRDSQIEARLAARANAAEDKQAVKTNFAHENSLEDLRLQWLKNNITSTQYMNQLEELNRVNDRARIQTLQLESIEEDIRKKQAQAVGANKRRQIQIALEARYGGALASVLVNLANVLESVRQRFIATFGPQIAEFLTKVVTAIRDAAPAIFNQFAVISTAVQNTFKSANLTIADIIKTVIKFMGDAANVVIKVVLPAFKFLIDGLNIVASVINSIFGTNFTASTLIAIGIVLKLVGLFGVLSGAISIAARGVFLLWAAFGPLGIIIGIIVAVILTQLIPILAKIDWAAIGTKAVEVWNNIVAVIVAAIASIKNAWNAIVTFFGDKINAIIGFFDNLIKKVKEFLGLTGQSGQLSKDAGIDDIGKALGGGGLFRGKPGIDSNLAWLTDGEYVIKRNTVRRLGVGFLNQLNNLAGRFKGFNAGGLVAGLSQPLPRVAYATGGLVQRPGGRPLILNLGDQQFEGLTVQDDTANNMARYAARRGIRSAGRRPMWFGGSR